MEICHKSVEIREKCDTGRTPGEGNEKRESPRKIGRVGKYGQDPIPMSQMQPPIQNCQIWKVMIKKGTK